jgi:hypothetical protein
VARSNKPFNLSTQTLVYLTIAYKVLGWLIEMESDEDGGKNPNSTTLDK